jgi:hypothetical protein
MQRSLIDRNPSRRRLPPQSFQEGRGASYAPQFVEGMAVADAEINRGERFNFP